MTIPNNEIKQAFLIFDPKKAITKESPFYVPCDDVRGEVGKNIADRIAGWIDISDEEGKSYSHCLFTGHVGSGKSTEVLNAKEKLEKDYDYHVIYLNALESLDINDVYPTDVLFFIAQKIHEEFDLDKKLIQNVERWFGEVIYETSKEEEYKAKIEAGVEAGEGIPLLSKIFAKFSGSISKGGTDRELIRRQLRKNVSELLNRVNEMLGEAERQTRNAGKGLVIIIDELEKMNSNKLRDEHVRADVFLYINNSNLFTGLNAHLVSTVPIFLLNSQNRTPLEKNYDKIFELPVIKIKETKSDTPYDKGIDKLVEIAEKRLQNLPLFGDDNGLLKEIAEFSGGQVRIFIQLIRKVLAECRLQQKFPADEELVNKVLSEEIRSYDMAIFDDRFDRLVEIAKSKRIKREEDMLMDFEMLQQGWVLAYSNKEWWYDVMPAIRCLDRFQKKLNESSPIQS